MNNALTRVTRFAGRGGWLASLVRAGGYFENITGAPVWWVFGVPRVRRFGARGNADHSRRPRKKNRFYIFPSPTHFAQSNCWIVPYRKV